MPRAIRKRVRSAGSHGQPPKRLRTDTRDPGWRLDADKKLVLGLVLEFMRDERLWRIAFDNAKDETYKLFDRFSRLYLDHQRYLRWSTLGLASVHTEVYLTKFKQARAEEVIPLYRAAARQCIALAGDPLGMYPHGVHGDHGTHEEAWSKLKTVICDDDESSLQWHSMYMASCGEYLDRFLK